MGEREERAVDRMMQQSENNSGEQKNNLYLGFLTKQQLIIVCSAVGLVILLIIVVVPTVLLTKSGCPSFPTDGDMLDYLVQSGDISQADGLLATWFHRANSQEDMSKALSGDAMILEADVTLEGYGTPNEKPIPIMAHPPDIHSDNTLDQWLDAVLASRKGVKLDFKSLSSVGLSLELLQQKNSSRGINRPVWLNADILQGPNVPDFVPPVNGTRFLQLVQEKFPDVTLSPGWKVLYSPPLFTGTYSRSMVEDMYDMIKDVPQKVTFPVHALLVRSGWQHLSWLLSRSPRFSLTLWQGSVHPNISDLLFVRDNTHPARVYYDIYEPTLSAFKQAARQQGPLRRFYPGGDLMDFLSRGPQRSSLVVRWSRVSDRTSLLTQLSDADGGMLVVRVSSDGKRPGVPLVEGSGKSPEVLTLQDLLHLLGRRVEALWGVFLRIQSQQLLEASLQLLHAAYSRERLYRPVWVSMEGAQEAGGVKRFVSAVERLFPHVTLVLDRPGPALSQRVAVHLSSLPAGGEALGSLLEVMDHCDLLVEEEAAAPHHLQLLLDHRSKGVDPKNIYVMSAGS